MAPSINNAGFDLVIVRFVGQHNQTLQIMIERQDRRPVTFDNCAEVDKIVSAILEVEDPLKRSYMLEVSSPGIERPLARISDYRRFSGFEVMIETSLPLNGAKIFQGRILRVEKYRVWLQCGSQSIVIALENVRNASLVPTEELIKAAGYEAALTAQMEQ